METATALFEHTCLVQLTSNVWREFCGKLRINISIISSYHSQSKGQVEQLNQELGRYRWSEFIL